MPATKDTTNNRIQLNEGTRASPKSLAAVVTDINDTTWIESLNGGATIVVKRSIWFNGFWLEYPNFVSVIFNDGCHPLMQTSGSGVIHRPYSRWSTNQTTAQAHNGPQGLRDNTTFVMEVDKDGSKPHIRSYGNRYDYPASFVVSGTTYARPNYEIYGATMSGTPNTSISNFCKLLGSSGSIFSGMTFVGDHMFEVFPNNTYTDFRSTSASPSYINHANISGTVVLNRWRVNQSSNYALGGWVDWNVAFTAQIDDLANDGTGVWNGTFAYTNQPSNITTILRHSVTYTFARGTVPITGVKVAIVNTATVGTAQAQVVLTSNGTGVATGHAVRAQGTGNTVSLRQQQRIFARSLNHDVPHAQLTNQELTAPVVETVQGTLSSLYGATEVVSGGALTKLTLNYSTKTINTTAPMSAAELYDSCRWSLYQDANLSQPDFLGLSTATTTHIGDWSMTGAQITGNVTTTGTIANTVTGVKVDANNAGQIVVVGPAATDTVEMRKASDNSLIASRTGAGAFAVAPASIGVSVYFERKVGTALVMSTVTTPVTLASVNANVALFAGDQVQVANLDGIAREATLLQRPTLAQMEASAVLTATGPTAAQNATAVRTELSTELARLDAAVSSRSTLTAAGVRTELSTELGRLDAAVSSRLASASYTAPTTPPTVAQIRAEMDSNSTKLANLDAAVSTRLASSAYTAPTTPPTASAVATAVRTELGTELGRIDTTVSSRLATTGYTAPTTPPTAAQNAAAVRTELSTELGRLDAAVSTRPTLAQMEASTALTATGPTAAAIRTEMETTGGKLDKTLKAAQAAEDQTL